MSHHDLKGSHKLPTDVSHMSHHIKVPPLFLHTILLFSFLNIKKSYGIMEGMFYFSPHICIPHPTSTHPIQSSSNGFTNDNILHHGIIQTMFLS